MTKFINDPSQINHTVVVTTCYGQTGNECTQEKAVLMSIKSEKRSTYKVLTQNGSLYEPTSLRFPREKQYQTITKKCFDAYLKCLSTGEYQDYEKAAREFRKSK
jgi:hypothetical protein